MTVDDPPDIHDLHEQLDAAEREARAVVEGLSEEAGARRPTRGSWSVAECFDHLATSNRVYLAAMRKPAERARARGRMRRGPARPGVPGGLFVASLEPPPRWWWRLRAPRKTRPTETPLGQAFAAFIASQQETCTFLAANADLDLAGVPFPNPFVRGIRFSLATGLHVIAAHERRHLLQARRMREAAEPARG